MSIPKNQMDGFETFVKNYGLVTILQALSFICVENNKNVQARLINFLAADIKKLEEQATTIA